MRVIRKIAAFMAAVMVVSLIGIVPVMAEEVVSVTLNYRDKSSSKQFYSVEISDIKNGVITEGINGIGQMCDGISFSCNQEVTFNNEAVKNAVITAIINNKPSVVIDLTQYVNGVPTSVINKVTQASNATKTAAATAQQEAALKEAAMAQAASQDAATAAALEAYKEAIANAPVATGIVKISECSTNFNPRQDRAVNVRSAAAHINGITIQPGQAFSANLMFTPRTAANGYGLGDIIEGDKHVKAMGGGICQVSSTLNVAVLRAGIIPVERHNHSSHIGYLASGLDATISSGTYDYVFVNTLDYPITIATSSDGGHLVIALYSDARALGGIVYEPVVVGSRNSSNTYVVGKLNGVQISNRLAYSSKYRK